VFGIDADYRNNLDFVLEGGSIESDGEGTLLTTSTCLLSDNRNDLTKEAVEAKLKEYFGLNRVLWLENGYLAGDDTDSHIDTLARFCDANTIAYVQCDDEADEHFESLKKMEEELRNFTTVSGKPYRLIPLPMADAVFEGDERLPATYANFLIINGAVLMPTYQSPKDDIALKQLELAFPDRKIIGINCLPLVKQHGSLHCVTMQYV
jgi:agmatine/peptidylarginine deiminase